MGNCCTLKFTWWHCFELNESEGNEISRKSFPGVRCSIKQWPRIYTATAQYDWFIWAFYVSGKSILSLRFSSYIRIRICMCRIVSKENKIRWKNCRLSFLYICILRIARQHSIWVDLLRHDNFVLTQSGKKLAFLSFYFVIVGGIFVAGYSFFCSINTHTAKKEMEVWIANRVEMKSVTSIWTPFSNEIPLKIKHFNRHCILDGAVTHRNIKFTMKQAWAQCFKICACILLCGDLIKILFLFYSCFVC